MKIAFAMEPDLIALAHFGQAECFVIYNDNDQSGAFRLEERRSNAPPCGSDNSTPMMSATVRLISDCAAVVADRFGPCALREMAAAGVYPLEMSGILDKRVQVGLTRLRDYLLGGKAKYRERNYS
jgi:predicted Fe-Mo cluster-binding NifX family protein